MDKLRCSRCGKMATHLCSYCYRCKQCNLECPEHMARLVNSVIGKKNIKKKE